MVKVKIKWSIKRAVVNFDEILDDETRSALEKAKAMCVEGMYSEALDCVPQIDFEFDCGCLDSEYKVHLIKPNYSFIIDKNSNNSTIKIGVQNNSLLLSISVVFEVIAVEGVDLAEFNEWLFENNCWAAGNAAGMWSYSEDDGGECCVYKKEVR